MAHGGRQVGFRQRVGGQPRRLIRALSGRLSFVRCEVGQLIGAIRIEIVDDAVALSRLSRHIDDEVGAHCRPEHHPTAFRRMRIARLAVIGDHHRIVGLETKRNDPGECCIDDSDPDPLPALHRYTVGNPAIQSNGIADPAGHPGFHAVAKTRSDPAFLVETPILDEPQEIAVDSDPLTFFDDQCAGKSTPKLLQRIGVWVVPEGAGVGRRELVDEALAGPDRFLRETGDPIHGIRQTDAVPMDGGVLAQLVAHRNPHRLALADPQFRAGHRAVIGPYGGIRVAVAGQVQGRRPRGEVVFLGCWFGRAAAAWEARRQAGSARAQHERASRNSHSSNPRDRRAVRSSRRTVSACQKSQTARIGGESSGSTEIPASQSGARLYSNDDHAAGTNMEAGYAWCADTVTQPT